jgi:hypothetical protein
MPRAVALFSGSLDSTLAVRIVERQGFAVHALYVCTLSDDGRQRAEQAAAGLGIALSVLPLADDYLDLVRRPRFGYGRGMNPCIDCRIYMCRMAKRLMDQLGAEIVVSGEVLGQRPMSQRRPDLLAIAKHSGLQDRLLRPLSAQLLPPTLAETRGLVDRAQLYAFTGAGRKPLLDLARQLGIRDLRPPSAGCMLADRAVAARLRDLLQYQPDASRWDFELTRGGRHIRYGAATKIVLGRRAEEDQWLQTVFAQEHRTSAALLAPANFRGPTALVVGTVDDAAVQFAGALMLLRSREADAANALATLTVAGQTRVIRIEAQAAATNVKSVGENGADQESRNAR